MDFIFDSGVYPHFRQLKSPTSRVSDNFLLIWCISHVSDTFPPLNQFYPYLRQSSPPILVFFPCVRQSSTQFSDKMFNPVLRQNPQLRQLISPTNIIPTSPTKIFTHFSDNYTQLSDEDILPTSPTFYLVL